MNFLGGFILGVLVGAVTLMVIACVMAENERKRRDR